MELLERTIVENTSGDRNFSTSSALSRETSITRAIPAINVIKREILGKVKDPHILVVGVGLDAGVVQCPYVPYRIASVFEQAGEAFKFTLLDCDPDIKWDISDREHIFLPNRYYSTPEVQQEWERYLADTSQVDKVIHQRVPGLRFEYDEYSEGEEDDEDFYQDYLRGGIHIADIPTNFRRMRSDKSLRIRIQDISTSDFDPESIHFVDCMNVFYMLDERKQREALVRLSHGLTQGGLIGLNDVGGSKRNPLFRELGGWATPKELSALNLEVLQSELVMGYTEAQDDFEPNTVNAVLRKIS